MVRERVSGVEVRANRCGSKASSGLAARKLTGRVAWVASDDWSDSTFARVRLLPKEFALSSIPCSCRR